ncbi:hypothetical protein LNKW23_43110 [Paralimibaculum aggregatum]|uniref:Uncharacterized protein n=1 Tax=Paralimibaculum aggregatum TaxID=3036245 RepID=A0ABQ6LSP5_9RHOB|nr:hypothetical protein LNKW23_43110 [Limibaculum sp. NKW23]
MALTKRGRAAARDDHRHTDLACRPRPALDRDTRTLSVACLNMGDRAGVSLGWHPRAMAERVETGRARGGPGAVSRKMPHRRFAAGHALSGAFRLHQPGLPKSASRARMTAVSVWL